MARSNYILMMKKMIDNDDEDEPVGGKDRESPVDGFAGEHVLFLLIADKKSTLVISSY